MRRRTARILTAGAALSAAVVLTAAPAAFAAQDITVTNPNADGAVAASAEGVALADSDTGTEVSCASSAADGTIASGSHTTPSEVGDLTVTFADCTGPTGGVTVDPVGPVPLHINSFDAATGTSTGWVGDISVSISTSICSFDVTGNLPASYDNATGALTVSPDIALPDGVAPLTAANVSGCLGLVNNGDALTIQSTYQITDPAEPITVA